MTGVGNLPLWQRLSELRQPADLNSIGFQIGFGFAIWGVLAAVLAIFAWKPIFRFVVTLLFLITATAGYFMWAYGVVIDPGMMINVLQTDISESTQLATGKFLAAIIAVGAIPAVWLYRAPLDFGGFSSQVQRNLLLLLVSISITVFTALAIFQPLASTMRNHKDVRYLINPLSSLYSLGRTAVQPWQQNRKNVLKIGEDAHVLQQTSTSRRPKLLLLIVGETARSENFRINGYSRDTTPQLAREDVISWRNVWSCGTSTAQSLPCMFSHLSRTGFQKVDERFEGLLDVLQRAGLSVLWIDNQSGCKGVCDRIPTYSIHPDQHPAELCPNGNCFDEVMLDEADRRLATLGAHQVAKGIVVVMHQMGSHGPAYFLRSPIAYKRFQPECVSASLQDCTSGEILNAYDNSIAYTDHFLARSIDWLRKRATDADTAMIYVSDHGESLGEHNLYLHGMPYSMAPDVQKHVPWITWLSPQFSATSGLSSECLFGLSNKSISHDNYFHSVLGMMDVETSAYSVSLDIYATCRNTAA